MNEYSTSVHSAMGYLIEFTLLRKEMFYLMAHAKQFIYGYVMLDIW